MNIQNAVLAADKRHALFVRGGVLVVGVSGGADSLALLHALAALRKRLGITVVSATLDHGLRGDAGAADVAHVAALAEAWRVPVVVGSADVADLAAAQQMGIEEAARKARYAFLATTAHEHGADRVAVGHHAGDQAETVLMHLLRGAGIDGLAGMQPLSRFPGEPNLRLIRPLLSVTRAEILAYCAAHHITPREDATNMDTSFTRAWLRHEALPMLELRFPGAARALADLAESAARDSALLAEMTTSAMLAAVISDDEISVPRIDFQRTPPALQHRIVRRAVALLAPEAELSHERTAAVVDLWTEGTSGHVIELSGVMRARVQGDRVLLARVVEAK